MRRAVLRALAASVAGGLPPRRPDQVSPSTAAGVAPGTATGTVRARQVIIFGTGVSTGLFVYNGQPAGPSPGPANPPQVAIVNSTTTQDPFGNLIATAKILIQANVITESGGAFRTSPVSPLIQLDGPHNAYLQYNAAAQLTESIAPVATNDGFGTAVPAGFTSYTPGTPTTFAGLIQGALVFGHSGSTVIPSIGGSGINIVANSGQDAAHAVEATLALISAAAGGVGTLQVGPLSDTALELTSTSVVPASVAGGPLAFGSGGQMRVIDASDGNNYATQRRFFAASAAAPGQLINSIAAVPVTGITAISVAAAAYHIRGMIEVLQGGLGPGNQAIQIVGPAISRMTIAFESVEGATIFSSGVATALATNIVTGAIPVNTTGELHFDGIIRFSAAGATFGLAAICVTAGADNWTLGTDSYLELSRL